MREEELVGRLYNQGNLDCLLERDEAAFKKQQESQCHLNLFKNCMEIIENIDNNLV